MEILYISINTKYKGMTLVMFCMNGPNCMCQWEVVIYGEVSLRMLSLQRCEVFVCLQLSQQCIK